MKRVTTASIVGVLALAGCGGGDDPEQEVTGNPPIGTFVSTSDIGEDGSAFSTPVKVTIGRAFVGWKARCNGFGAEHVPITDDQLMIAEASSVGSTLIGCAQPLQHQDDQIEAFFNANPHWQLDGDRLTLSDDSVEVVLRRVRNRPNS